jgi:hypothetical protein
MFRVLNAESRMLRQKVFVGPVVKDRREVMDNRAILEVSLFKLQPPKVLAFKRTEYPPPDGGEKASEKMANSVLRDRFHGLHKWF